MAGITHGRHSPELPSRTGRRRAGACELTFGMVRPWPESEGEFGALRRSNVRATREPLPSCTEVSLARTPFLPFPPKRSLTRFGQSGCPADRQSEKRHPGRERSLRPEEARLGLNILVPRLATPNAPASSRARLVSSACRYTDVVDTDAWRKLSLKVVRDAPFPSACVACV